MKCFVTAVLVFSAAFFAAASLAARPLAFCEAPPTIDEARVRDYFATRQVVVVHGYWGGKFDDNREAIHEIDACIPVTSINPAWRASVEENAEALIPRLRALAAENFGNEIVLIGHSKGGAEVLQLAVMHPEIFERGNSLGFTVSVVVPIQAAVGGSALADLELARDPALTTRWDAFKTANGGAGDSMVARWLKNIFLGAESAGFRSLASRESAERNEALLRKFSEHPPATRALLSRKIAYVTAMRDPAMTDDLPFYLRHLGKFLAEGGEPSDGLLELRNQFVPGIGRELFNVSRAGHFSLVAHLESARCRREFTRALLSELVGTASIPKFPIP